MVFRKDQWKIKKTITIPAQPAAAEDLPAPLKQFGAAPPPNNRYKFIS